MSRRIPRGVFVVALLMIVFGLAEVATGFTHRFLGLATARVVVATYASAAIGTLYVAAGALVLTMKKSAAALAIAFLIADIAGRLSMIATGLYPLGSFRQTSAIILGTSLVAAFAVYIRFKWPLFR
jgi:hypothetical protein